MFGASSSSQQNSNGISDLLLGGAGGFAGAGSSLGNGFGNSAVATDTSSTSGAATMAPGGTANGTTTASGANSSNSNTTFDLNDFPSLGGTVVMQGASNSDSNQGVSAALRDQHRLLAHHNQQLLHSIILSKPPHLIKDKGDGFGFAQNLAAETVRANM